MSSLEDHSNVNIEVGDVVSRRSGRSVSSTKTVRFDKTANEKSSQTESRICGRVISFQEHVNFRALQDVHKAAAKYVDRKRDAKAAEKEFNKAKHNIKVFKAMDMMSE